MRTTKELLGARIREIRKGNKFSQEQLAERVDVDPRYISRIELGKCFPSLETLEVIAQALSVELRELFDFNHLVTDNAPISEIEKLLDSIDDAEKQQLILRITKAVTRAVKLNV
jgi:transcriptional regulator with XRE-family HTH domain